MINKQIDSSVRDIIWNQNGGKLIGQIWVCYENQFNDLVRYQLWFDVNRQIWNVNQAIISNQL